MKARLMSMTAVTSTLIISRSRAGSERWNCAHMPKPALLITTVTMTPRRCTSVRRTSPGAGCDKSAAMVCTVTRCSVRSGDPGQALDELYEQLSGKGRRLLNQAAFDQILIDQAP
jgi:hypothetical protein